jgi:hypothetical protein
MILYLINSTICLILLLLVYHLILGNEKMHHFNRFFLLFSIIFSLTIPLIPTGVGGILLPWAESGQVYSSGAIQSVTITGEESAVAAGNDVSAVFIPGFLVQMGVLLYGLITMLLFIRFIVKIDSILLKVKRNRRIPYGKAEIILLKKKTIPYSFFNYIFLSKQDYEDGKIKKQVLIHEYTHIRQKHTLDVLFIEVLKILFWFNPVFHFYKKAIQLNHEFLADQVVVSRTGRVSDYQSLLLNSVRLQPQFMLASNFNFSMTKKRILMMTHKTSDTRALFKKITIIPLLAGAALIFGCQITAQESESEEWTENQIITIEIDDSEIIKVNSEEIHINHLDQQLAGFTDWNEYIIELKVHRDAYFGVIMDVQRTLREKGSLRINYSLSDAAPLSKQEIQKPELDRIIEEFLHLANRYMQMSVDEYSLDELQKTYEDVMKSYHAIDEKQQEVYSNGSEMAPPLPPVPPNPEQRLESGME